MSEKANKNEAHNESFQSLPRFGVTPQAIATCAWISALGAAFIPYLIAIPVLIIEKNTWLRKQLVQMLIVFSGVKVINRLIIDEIINRMFIVSEKHTPVLSWITIAIYVAEDLAFLYFAYRAWKGKTTGVLAIEKLCNKCTADNNSPKEISYIPRNKCPQCGKPINDEMDFCMGCGYKLDKTNKDNNFASGYKGKEKASTEDDAKYGICPQCGKPVNDEMDFCMSCGYRLENIRMQYDSIEEQADVGEEPIQEDDYVEQNVCPQCGRPIDEEMMFCMGCGQKLR